MIKKCWIMILIIGLLNGCYHDTQSNKAPMDKHEKSSDTDSSSENTLHNITIHIKESTYTTALSDTVAAQQFLSMLPLDLTMEDMNHNEKYQYLNSQLTMQAEDVKTITAGDIMLYGSDCIVFFYESFPTSYSYTKLAHIDDERFVELLRSNETISVHITSP